MKARGLSPLFVTICLLCLLIPILSACQTFNNSADLLALPPTPVNAGELAPRATLSADDLPLLAAYQEAVRAALAAPVPILLLDHDEMTDEMRAAQTAVVNDMRLGQFLYSDVGEPLRVEVFGVYPLRDSDMSTFTSACANEACYRVELYNFALNLTIIAKVSATRARLLELSTLTNAQPDIPPHLRDIALEIATQSPEVRQALGFAPTPDAALMAETKTSLNNTLCERSQHLCVAPTFVSGGQALWAIVDLTAARLVGTRWTWVGWTGDAATPAPDATLVPFITERSLQNEVIIRDYCETNTALERDGWRMDYILTSSDGLRISDVTFGGAAIFESVKLVDWHVSYSRTEGFGYSDAVGCPVFSQAAVIAVTPPRVEDITEGGEVVGFALIQDFWSELWPQPCNYYYRQSYEFYQDGRFRPVVASVGRGCGDDGTYRPVTRIALPEAARFAAWTGSAWQDWTEEGWVAQADTPADSSGSPFRISTASGDGFYIQPSSGQFGDGGRGDNALIYVTRLHPDRDEGNSDLVTIGPCCNEDYQQGPERFIEPEPLGDDPLVIWYVAQLENEGAEGLQYCWSESVLQDGVYVPIEYPCPSGALFVPLG
jgi:hypothetical protein